MPPVRRGDGRPSAPGGRLALTWAGIDGGRDRGRLLVRPDRTEHTKGGGLRWVPVFPDLRPRPEALSEAAEPGAAHDTVRRGRPARNLRPPFLTTVVRAGLLPWPRPVQNLRSRRAAGPAARFPTKAVAARMGNSVRVAPESSLQIRPEDLENAEKPAPKAVHNPLPHPTVGRERGGRTKGREARACGGAAPCVPRHSDAHPTSSRGRTSGWTWDGGPGAGPPNFPGEKGSRAFRPPPAGPLSRGGWGVVPPARVASGRRLVRALAAAGTGSQ